MPFWASHMVLVVKNLPASAGDIRWMSSIPGSGKSRGEGNGNPLQYSCLKNPKDRGTSLATVHRVAKSQTPLKRVSMHACMPFFLLEALFSFLGRSTCTNLLVLKGVGLGPSPMAFHFFCTYYFDWNYLFRGLRLIRRKHDVFDTMLCFEGIRRNDKIIVPTPN